MPPSFPKFATKRLFIFSILLWIIKKGKWWKNMAENDLIKKWQKTTFFNFIEALFIKTLLDF